MRELLDGERSQTMNKEMKETLDKVAVYEEWAKRKALKAGNLAFASMFMIGVAAIIIQMLLTVDIRFVLGETISVLAGGILYAAIMVYNGMGSWEAPLLSKTLRDKNGIELENVGAMALPTAEDDGQLTVRSYIDSGIGVVDYSEKKEAAAKFVAYMTLGDGADIFGKQLTGTSAKKDFAVDESLFDTEESKAGWDTIVDLINTATADRNKTENNNCLLISGNAPSNVQPNYVECDHPIVYEEKNPGMAFCCYLQAVHIGGSATVSSDSLSIKDADEIVFYLTAADGYKGYDQKIETNPEACEKNCRDQIRILNSKTYDELEKEHIKDYQSVYKDVSLELDGEEYDLPTDERLRRVQNGKQDLGLSCLFFHYNRYLMIASSRKGTQPANLQGIWSESIRPVWSSNWTTNINTEMNYWLNGPCNLIESFEPFVDFVEELSHAGEETAKKQCHCSGWTANHNVDIWRQTGPVDGEPKYAYWPMGGVWLCSQSYEYFRYSEDLKTLKNKIYPSLRGSVLFCLDWMQQREDGLYYTAPSTSPENTFEDDEGHSCGVSYMTTMDLAIIKELFANYLAAADVLGIEEDLIKLVKERSKLLPGYQIGKTGMIQEWIKDFEKSDVGHRHFSPVFGFHPGHSIKKTDTELVQACQNFIEEKAENFKQQIGWSCAWLINLWARLGDGTKANHYYEELLRQSVYDNLFDLHPPLGETEGEREVFQIDGNFGSASGVAEMLISSEKGKITILPALPDSWKNGKVRGLLAAGAIEVDITWKDRKPVSVSLRSSSDQNVSLFYRNRKLAEQIELKKQEQQIINLCSC